MIKTVTKKKKIRLTKKKKIKNWLIFVWWSENKFKLTKKNKNTKK